MPELTPKQAAFVREYLIDLNATQAAIRAGYSPKTAYRTGADNLRKHQVADAIAKAQAERSERLQLTHDWVLERLVQNHERAMQAEPVMRKERDEWVETGEYQYQGNVANKALELIGKHLGMFTEKTEQSGEITVRIVRE